MRKSFLIGLLLLLVVSLSTACDQKEVMQTSKPNHPSLNIQLSKPDGQSYTVYKKIEDKETVDAVMSILLNVSWENVKVSMSRQPDYRISPINTDPTSSYEPVTYDIWISPMKDILEIVSQSNYGKMTKKDSQKLLYIFDTP